MQHALTHHTHIRIHTRARVHVHGTLGQLLELGAAAGQHLVALQAQRRPRLSHSFLCVCVYVCMCVRVYVCMYVHVCCVCVCMCVILGCVIF